MPKTRSVATRTDKVQFYSSSLFPYNDNGNESKTAKVRIVLQTPWPVAYKTKIPTSLLVARSYRRSELHAASAGTVSSSAVVSSSRFSSFLLMSLLDVHLG